MTASIQTIDTPDGAFTIVADDRGRVLASGWTADADAAIWRASTRGCGPESVREAETDAAAAVTRVLRRRPLGDRRGRRRAAGDRDAARRAGRRCAASSRASRCRTPSSPPRSASRAPCGPPHPSARATRPRCSSRATGCSARTDRWAASPGASDVKREPARARSRRLTGIRLSPKRHPFSRNHPVWPRRRGWISARSGWFRAQERVRRAVAPANAPGDRLEGSRPREARAPIEGGCHEHDRRCRHAGRRRPPRPDRNRRTPRLSRAGRHRPGAPRVPFDRRHRRSPCPATPSPLHPARPNPTRIMTSTAATHTTAASPRCERSRVSSRSPSRSSRAWRWVP